MPSSVYSFAGSVTSRLPARVFPPMDSSLSASLYRKHTALEDNFPLAPQQWRNVNRRIVRTVDIILPHGPLIQGPGPKRYELHANLGVALVANIVIRPNRRPCSLANVELQHKISIMAADPRQSEFRHTYHEGRVWFSFCILDLELASLPLLDDIFSIPEINPEEVEKDEEGE